MKNRALQSVIVLASICLVVALLLSAVNTITAPIIKAAEESAANEAYMVVLPDATELEVITLDGDTPPSVQALLRDKGGSGYAFKLLLTGTYTGKDMTLIVGIGPDGKIIKMSFVEYTDSKGSADAFNTAFVGKDNTADGISGATVTSTAIKNALSDAYKVLAKHSTIEQSDEQKLSPYFESLMPAAKNTASGAVKFSPVDMSQFVGLDPAVTAVFTPINEIGHIAIVKTTDSAVAVAVNAFGKAYKAVDTEGKEIENAEAMAKAEALPPMNVTSQSDHEKKINSALKKKFGRDGVGELTFEPITLDNASTVTGVYKVTHKGTENYLAFFAQAVGYHGMVQVLYLMDYDGNIVICRTTAQSESAGYGDKIGQSSYTDKIVGNIETLTDETVLVSGATITSTAVKQAKNDIKAAYLAVKEGF